MSLVVFMLAVFCSRQTFYLGGHDELVVDDVVWSVAHTKQGAGGMEVTRHACPHVHVFTNALGANTGINNKLNVRLRIPRYENGVFLCLHVCVHFKVRAKRVIWVNTLLHPA